MAVVTFERTEIVARGSYSDLRQRCGIENSPFCAASWLTVVQSRGRIVQGQQLSLTANTYSLVIVFNPSVLPTPILHPLQDYDSLWDHDSHEAICIRNAGSG